MLAFIRTWLPGMLCAAGVAYIVVKGGTEASLHVGIPVFSAGASIWLLNFLYRVGVSGDHERTAEETAREFHDRHGRWPSEQELRELQAAQQADAAADSESGRRP